MPIAEASARFYVPPDRITRVIRLESEGATHLRGLPIRNPAGAIGLMQLMPATWHDMNLRRALGSDPDVPTTISCRHRLSAAYAHFGYPSLCRVQCRTGAHGRPTERGSQPPGESRSYLELASRKSVARTTDQSLRTGLFAIKDCSPLCAEKPVDRLFAILAERTSLKRAGFGRKTPFQLSDLSGFILKYC